MQESFAEGCRQVPLALSMSIFSGTSTRSSSSRLSRSFLVSIARNNRHGASSLSDVQPGRSFDLRSPPRPFWPRRVKSLCGLLAHQPAAAVRLPVESPENLPCRPIFPNRDRSQKRDRPIFLALSALVNKLGGPDGFYVSGRQKMPPYSRE